MFNFIKFKSSKSDARKKSKDKAKYKTNDKANNNAEYKTNNKVEYKAERKNDGDVLMINKSDREESPNSKTICAKETKYNSANGHLTSDSKADVGDNFEYLSRWDRLHVTKSAADSESEPKFI